MLFMLPIEHRIAFAVFAAVMIVLSAPGFHGVYRRIRMGRADSDRRADHPWKRLRDAFVTTILQSRAFRRRPAVTILHSFIFYGFTYYILLNLVDAVEGYTGFSISSAHPVGALYNLLADLLSVLVLIGVVALVARRYLVPARRDFRFNEKTLLHPLVKRWYIQRDSAIVSAFIFFHVSSRLLGAAAKLRLHGSDSFQPIASAVSRWIAPNHAMAWSIFAYWGALGSILAFLLYFPYSKHIHLFFAPVKYFFARQANSGVLPYLDVNMETAGEDAALALGAGTLKELTWPRLLDAYACIQCNRCQDACPASATGKSLSPAALVVNKRMELNSTSVDRAGSRALLDFALTPEALWACTTCGACLEACPVQNEPMMDLVELRRHQVMMTGEFPTQLQAAFRGMERTGNPWGINHEKRMEWAEGLNIRTIEENPQPEVLYWVGCAPAYDPQAQKAARAFARLMQIAGVNFAVLGKKESCTGDSARRAGNEFLFQELARKNIATLNAVQPKLIVTTCPHCMNTIGHEYKQLGGDYKVMHHTEFLHSLVASGRLQARRLGATITFHDPCYLGRHNGVYDAPRNLLSVLSDDCVEMPRNREKSFCCGGGGAQFWKEEEEGREKIAANRVMEARDSLQRGQQTKVLAVGCPFCKSMLSATPEAADGKIEIRDVAELLLEGVQGTQGASPEAARAPDPGAAQATASGTENAAETPAIPASAPSPSAPAGAPADEHRVEAAAPTPIAAPKPAPPVERKKWTPKGHDRSGP
jgi:Fe-S oxidoreductase